MNWRNTRVLVSGATGFIGSHIVKRMVAQGAQVHILIRKDSSTWRINECLDKVTVWEADIQNLVLLQDIISRCNPQVVFHFAALVDVSRSWDIVYPMINNNILGTVNLLTSLRECDLKLFINIGSSEEYGDLSSPQNENQKESPVSPYSFSKAACLSFCQMAARIFSLPIINLRLFPTYGPYQESSMFIPSAIRELMTDGEFRMSPGEQKREFNYISDVVEAIFRVAECSSIRGEIINIGSGNPYQIKDVVNIVSGLVGNNVSVHIGALPYRKGDAMESYCDNKKLRDLTGWSPVVSLQEGVRLTVEWFRSYYKV